MHFSDFCYSAALVILLGWLILGSVIDTEYSDGPLADQNAAASPPAVSSSSPHPQQLATATIDERRFRIFVAESPDVWSVAVSEDD
jgi:hypothetical protein